MLSLHFIYYVITSYSIHYTKLYDDQSDVFRVDGPLDLTYLFPFTDLNEYNQYKYGSDPPQESLSFRQDENMFDAIKEKDILV